MSPAVLRLGIIGCGQVVEQYHLPALARTPDWTLTAACEPVAARRAWMAAAHPQTTVVAHPDELPADLDGVLIATPPDSHAALACRALAQGRHVLLEKPMARHDHDAAALRAAVASSGRVLALGFNRRFRTPYQQLRKRLARLPAGQIAAVRCAMQFDSGRWRAADPSELLDDVASHQIDLLAWLLGQPAIAVRAARYEQGQASGVRYTLRLAGGLEAECVAAYSSRYHEQLAVLAGTRWHVAHPGGVLSGHNPNAPTLRLAASLLTRAGLVISRLSGRPSVARAGFAAQLRAFAQAVRGGSAHGLADHNDGAYTVAAVAACRASLASGAWEPIQVRS